jgi:hypothetical protein
MSTGFLANQIEASSVTAAESPSRTPGKSSRLGQRELEIDFDRFIAATEGWSQWLSFK